MSERKRILVIGGGYGGVWAGKILERRFRHRRDVEITLVDRHPFHTLMTELHEVAGWRTEPDSVQVGFRKVFGTKRIACAVDEIAGIDFEAKKAWSAHAEYPFDYVLIGTGAEPEYFGTPGAEENSFSLWSLDDALRIRAHIETAFRKAVDEPDPGARRRLLSFVVAGGGFTGVEMAGELLEYRDYMCRKLRLDASETSVRLVEAMPSVLPMLEDGLRIRAERRLRSMGCDVMVGTPIVGAEPGRILLSGGSSIEAGTFIWTCGVTGNGLAACLDLPHGKRNRIATDLGLCSEKYPFAFVVGDAAGTEFEGKPAPMIVESAHFTAETAALNIVAAIEGGERREFDPHYHGYMVSIGSRYGVSNAGGIRLSGFLAILMKHLINLLYLFRIAGANQVWEYLKHEFLDMKSGRSVIGGFAAYKIRGYWPLLLRLWLGISWVFEGVNKIGEGWLSFPGGSRSGWMFSPGVIQAGTASPVDAASAATATADSVSAATSAAIDAASAATATLVDSSSAASAAASDAIVAAVDAASAATHAAAAAAEAVHSGAPAGPVWDFAKPVLDANSPLVSWFTRTFMDGVFAHVDFRLFQSMVVGTEIAIGLALLGGLFTWFGAVASIGLCIVFTLSGMFTWNQLWFVVAAILMMGGAGRSFGLDYWAIPPIKRWWNGTGIARHLHLYADDPTK